eukprot:6921164-Ditylum_brightwellii.AAC.1
MDIPCATHFWVFIDYAFSSHQCQWCSIEIKLVIEDHPCLPAIVVLTGYFGKHAFVCLSPWHLLW